jgi:lipid II isoglutaminyl synthase (glutamine-hydrolysing)
MSRKGKNSTGMIQICHLYPDLLNLYGDRGNVLAFAARCRWRDLPVFVHQIRPGENVDFKKMDFLFLGGGSDREQGLMAEDLKSRTGELGDAIEEGLVVLAICGGYQLLGNYYLTGDGQVIPGLGLMNFYTQAGEKRMIGNVAVEIELGGKKYKLAGFENHAGKTYLNNITPLGRVLSGYGNNGEDGFEGARYKNVFCSYLHGPLPPKNPELTDFLISAALKRRGLPNLLEPLDDSLEASAKKAILQRMRVK